MRKLEQTLSSYLHHFFWQNPGEVVAYPTVAHTTVTAQCVLYYSTVIAQLVHTKKGTVCVVLDGGSTTCNSRLKIIERCRPHNVPSIAVWDDVELCAKNKEIMLGELLRQLETIWCSGKLTQKHARESLAQFGTAWECALRYGLIKPSAADKRRVSEAMALIDPSVSGKEAQKAKDLLDEKRKSREEAANKKKCRNVLKVVHSLTEKFPIHVLSYFMYNYGTITGLSRDFEAAHGKRSFSMLQDTFEHEMGGATLYIHTGVSNLFVDTSLSSRVPAAEAKAALKLYFAGKLRHGAEIGRYKVLKVSDDSVTVGCHVLSRKVLQDMYSALDSIDEVNGYDYNEWVDPFREALFGKPCRTKS